MYPTLVFIALREVRRSLGRFVLLTGAVSLLVILLLFFQAVAGTLTSGLTGGLESSSADIFVFDERARGNPFASVLDPQLVDEVASIDGVEAAAPIAFGVFSGSTPDGDVDLVIVGGDSSGPSVPSEITEGRRPETQGEALYSGSSFDAPLAIGDEVTVGALTLEIVGIAENAAFNVSPTFYVLVEDYASASQERAGVPIDVPISLVGVTVAADTDQAALAESITASLDDAEAIERSAAVDGLPGVGQITQSFSILYLLLYIVVTIVTGVFFLILTVQKKDALVLLRAVGASSQDIIKSVLIQVLLVVGFGSLLGSAVTAGLLALTTDVFGASLDPTTTTITVGAIVVLGLAASIGAIRRVLAIDPVAATYTGGI